jgi:hypothetical protein
MMSQKLKLIGAGIVALALIAIGYYSLHTAAPTISAPQVTHNTQSGKKIAFSQLAQQGGTYKCTVNQNVGTTTTQGIVYLNKGLVRGDFTAPYNGQNVQVTFLMRDGLTYVWNSLTPGEGVKMKNNLNVPLNNSSTTSPIEYLDQIGGYTCIEWAATNSIFEVPTSVTFKAIN